MKRDEIFAVIMATAVVTVAIYLIYLILGATYAVLSWMWGNIVWIILVTMLASAGYILVRKIVKG